MAKKDDSIAPLVIGALVLYWLSKRTRNTGDAPDSLLATQAQGSIVAPDRRYLGPPIQVYPDTGKARPPYGIPRPGKDFAPPPIAPDWN